METTEAMRVQALAEALFGPASPYHRALVAAGYHLVPEIPEKKLVGALATYARIDFRAETPLLLMDDTVFGNGKRGFMLTTRALYYNITNPVDGSGDHRGEVALAGVREFRVIGDAIWVNGQKLGTFHHPPEGAVRGLEAFFAGLRGEEPPPPEAPGTGRATTPEAILATIRGLKALRDEGALEADEFQAKKRELLERL